jgi:hypothetical protein
VTNAILHAEPPITVTVRGTRKHPRVEVTDSSQQPPEVNVRLADDDQLLSTIGRGLGIVALHSLTWGSEVAREGKTVWFVPAAGIQVGHDLSGEIFDLDDVVGRRLAEAAPAADLLHVRLLRMPVQVFAHYRKRFAELQRELRLLALAHETDYPVGRDLSDLFLQIEQERRQSQGVDQLDAAIVAGHEEADLDYLVPPTAPASMSRMLEMLERADAFCREQRLLALAASPQQVELQRWYLGEFARQAEGEPPQPWHGSLRIEDAPA